jgi:SHS2 domain-containing protein
MGETPSRWRTIEHTADLAIEVEAPSLERLFVTGALGMSGVLLGWEDGSVESEPDKSAVWRELVLEAPDREALFVDWLRELLYIQITEGLLFSEAEISSLDDTRLIVRAAFRSPASDSPVERELKGVTYHDLVVTQRDGGWFARIVFDL